MPNNALRQILLSQMMGNMDEETGRPKNKVAQDVYLDEALREGSLKNQNGAGFPPSADAAEMIQTRFPRGVPANLNYEATKQNAERNSALRYLQMLGYIK